jgi:type I restriction enzyme S subunit
MPSTETGVNFIKAEALNGDCALDRSGFTCISESTHEKLKRSILDEDDVLLTIAGAQVGRCGIVRADHLPANTNQAVGIIRVDRSKANPWFVYYFFKDPKTFSTCQGIGGQAAQPNINLTVLKGFDIRVPALPVQVAIVEVLSAYDDLIDNNRRRIALLEEAARMLYREWFVSFRFPGHEHIRIVDGIPEGWEQRPFGQIAELNYGKALKEEKRIEGAFPVYGSSGIVGTHQAALVEGATIVVGRKGNVGSIYWSPVNFWPIDTVYFIPREQADFWLYLVLPSAGFQNTDAGVPGLNRDFAYSRKLICPNPRLRRLFNETVEPMFAQRTTLENYNQKLAQARDLLLPRLMNGELAV